MKRKDYKKNVIVVSNSSSQGTESSSWVKIKTKWSNLKKVKTWMEVNRSKMMTSKRMVKMIMKFKR